MNEELRSLNMKKWQEILDPLHHYKFSTINHTHTIYVANHRRLGWQCSLYWLSLKTSLYFDPFQMYRYILRILTYTTKSFPWQYMLAVGTKWSEFTQRLEWSCIWQLQWTPAWKNAQRTCITLCPSDKWFWTLGQILSEPYLEKS